MSIPAEMMQYAAWVVWRLEVRDGKPTKVPYQVRTLLRASVIEPSHWSSYADALKLYNSGHGNYNGLGFVLSKYNPYTIVDLDSPMSLPENEQQPAIDRAMQVLTSFNTYTELSQSGEGYHLIMHGKIPGAGRRKGKIEIYSEARFFAMTGNTTNDVPIADCSYLANNLWHDLGGTQAEVIPSREYKQRHSDEEVFNRACKAHEMFKPLFMGKYHEYYPSQSQADFALINLISFYSRNKEQIARMFLLSELGKRNKAKRRSYMMNMIEKSFDNQIPDIPLDDLMGNLNLQIAKMKIEQQTEPKSMLGSAWDYPPGLMGEIADFIYRAAPRPVHEIALAGAIGLMAGICGQAFNISGTGLNHYVLLLATTGRGKEAAKSGISKIMNKVIEQLPSASTFVGPGDIASGQALAKYMTVNPCFVTIIGEFGEFLQNMCAPNASTSQRMIRKVILDLYNKSGQSDTLDPTIYSDTKVTTSTVRAPALSILGETTPDNFFPFIDEFMIAQGLLPRFTCIEYTGKRMPENKNHHHVQPAEEMIESLITLCTQALSMQHRNEAISVECDAFAQQRMDAFNETADDLINHTESEVGRQLWTRAHLKALRLAALIAVGVHPFAPIISLTTAEWAVDLVQKDIANVLNRFESGRIGKESGEQNQLRHAEVVLKDYVLRQYDDTSQKYGIDEKMHGDKVIQWSYLCKRLMQLPAFKTDKMGSKFAMTRTMMLLIDMGVLVEVSPQQQAQRYARQGKIYAILDLTKME